MEIDMNEQHWEQEACPKYDCRKENCKCGMKRVFLATALGDDSEDSPIAPKNGAYCNAIVVYEANEHVYIYSTEGIPTLVESNGKELKKLIEELEDGLAQEILDRQAADNALQQEIDDIKSSPDVVDIVATYAALQAYDTSHLGDNDIIRVLADETHDGQSTYYRWNKTTSTWTYIGAVGDYYTKTQVDTLLNAKQNTLTAGDNITINGNVISANGGIFLVRASETTSQSQTPEGSDLQDYAGQTGLYVDDVYSDPTVPGAGNIYYVYNIGIDPETEDPYAEYALIANMREAWTAIASIGNMMPTGGFGAPDSSTPGQAGQLYIDAQNYVLYVCIDDSNPYVWQQLGGGGGDTVYSDKSTSNSSTGGAVYIGNLDANQAEQVDPTTTDNHNKYFWALPFDNTSKPGGDSVVILGKTDGRSGAIAIGGGGSGAIAYGNTGIAIGLSSKSGQSSVALGGYANAGETGVNISGMTAIGNSAQASRSSYAVDIGANTGNSYGVLGSSSANSVTIGKNATIVNITNSVSLGAYARATRQGEVNIGLVTGETTGGYNNTAYRVIGGVHDPVDTHDAATKGYVDANAGGGVKTLSSADYNWNKDTSTATEPYNAVALWLLPDGFYKPATESVYISAAKNSPSYFSIGNFSQFVDLYCVNTVDTKKYIHLFANNSGGMNRRVQLYTIIRLDSNGDIMYPYYDALPTSAVVNDLTWTLSGSALDARQGKVLKDLIDNSAIGTTETFTKATSDWTALAASSPYTFSTTVTLATTLSASSEVELINDQLVAFANYGFGILSITGQVATIASIGQPDSSITFKIKVRG